MQNLKYFTFLSALVAASVTASAANPIEGAPQGYTLRWSDEFDGTVLNEKNWQVEVNGNGGGNQELQYYCRENVSVGADPATGENCLIITARREDYQGRKFTSGRVNSQGRAAFKHGILQARVKFPDTKNGLWPAYWMMGNDIQRYGWPRCGEMDIVELGHANGIASGTQSRYFGGTLHYGPDASQENHQQLSQEFTAPEDNPITGNGYHIITVEWDEQNLYMYYDLAAYNAAQKRKARYFSTTVPYTDEVLAPGHYFQKPFYFLFNLAVGGWYPNILDAEKITALPNMGDEAKMYVDWVRVYQADDDADALYLYTDASGNNVTNIPAEPEPPHHDDNVTELSSFATEALDAEGKSTFDFNDCEDVVLISTSEGVTGNFKAIDAVLADYNVDETKNFLYIWNDTYVANGTAHRTNSFGWDEGYNRFAVTTVGWSGLGFASSAGNGKDLSMIDDSYWLHFAMKADDIDMHTSHSVYLGDAQFRIGNTDGKLVSLGDFKRDGKWYYFDIPVKALHELATEPFGDKANAYEGNVFALLSGGVEGAELCFDNIFLYKSKSKTIPNYTDTSADLGKYGYKSLDENGKPVFDFAKAENVTPLILSGDMWEHLTAGGTYNESIVAQQHDNSEQAGKNNFFSWDNSFKGATVTDVPNSFGNIPYGGFATWSSTIGKGWNGAGWASIEGQGMTPAPKDLSHIDDSYVLHFSVRSNAAVAHAPFTIKLGSEGTDAGITLGSYSNGPIFADFNRNGEWYSFDIPLKEIRKYGKIWGNAEQKGGISAYTDYSLTFNTGGTFYSGCPFSIDNVFLYRPADYVEEPGNELGIYTHTSLDESGNSYFDFSDKEFWPLTAGAKERLAMGEDNIVADFGINDQNTHIYPWEGTYEAAECEGVNSFGNEENWLALTVTKKGWSGLGIINDDGYDMRDMDDNTYLHFALRTESADQDFHLILGKAHFTIGNSAYVNNNNEVYPWLGNLTRDGKWNSYDIPLSVFKSICTDLWAGKPNAFNDNLICVDAGSKEGNRLDLDNIFFWREKKDSGISDLETEGADATEAEVIDIYTINGLKVNDMSKPGLYIIRTTKGVLKRLVK